MSDKQTEMKDEKNYLGASSLMFGIFAISGCWIPLFNILAISLAIVSFLLGIWSMVKILRTEKKIVDRVILSLSGILISLVAIVTALSMNRAIFSSHGGIKSFMIEVMDAMTGKNINESSQKTVNNTKKSADSVVSATQAQNQILKTYKIGESAELDGRKITILGVEKNFSMDNGYSSPKEGMQFVKISAEIENTSDSEILVSPQEFSIEDNMGVTVGVVAATYLLDDHLESDTSLSPGSDREGTVIFEVPVDVENLKLIYKVSSSDSKLEFDLQ